MTDSELAKSVADRVIAQWSSVCSQLAGSKLMETHNIQNKVRNLMTRYKFAYNDSNTKIATKQQTILARDAPKFFDIRSCR